jgi:acetyl-CoA synthetase
MFRGYWADPERYARCFSHGWYLPGTSPAGTPHPFVSRADVIKSAGHLVGPFEVETR